MIIVGKAIHGPNSVEIELPELRRILKREGYIAYAWTFNPKEWAIRELREELNRNQWIWLYLVGEPWHSPLRMRIIDFRHSTDDPLPCPPEWIRYVPQRPPQESYIDGSFKNWKNTGEPKSIRLWFLIDQIEDLSPPEDLRRFPPYFSGRPAPPRYCEYKQGCFAFLKDGEDC